LSHKTKRNRSLFLSFFCPVIQAGRALRPPRAPQKPANTPPGANPTRSRPAFPAGPYGVFNIMLDKEEFIVYY
jgi:hypothetical protein